MDDEPQQEWASRASLVVTNLIKLAGIVIAVHEAFGAVRPAAIGLAAFMLAGATSLESFFASLFGGKK